MQFANAIATKTVMSLIIALNRSIPPIKLTGTKLQPVFFHGLVLLYHCKTIEY
jgi:hypothetical protein